jgi:hypothetical protein
MYRHRARDGVVREEEDEEMDRWGGGRWELLSLTHRHTTKHTPNRHTHNRGKSRNGGFVGSAVGSRWMIAWARVRANDPHLPAASTREYLSIAPLDS